MLRKALVALAAALAFAPSALAKSPLQVCGASGCILLSDEVKPPVRVVGFDASTPRVAPPAPAPYYIIEFSRVPVPEPLAYWIPSASALRLVAQNGTGAWVATLPNEEALLRDKTAGMRPYPAPKRAVVYVDYEPARRATGYFGLFTIGTPVAAVPSTSAWMEVWLRGGHSPWNDGATLYWISRKGSLLKRDDGVVLTISPGVARRIRAGLPLG